jgi:Na+/proline symporter
MEKKLFLARLILFTIFACVLPFSFIAWRYHIFTTLNSVSLSGWGIIAIVIALVFIVYVARMLKRGMPYSMLTQCIGGLLKVTLPLILLYVVVNAIKNQSEIFLQALLVVIISETIAIPINPFPKWLNDNQIKKEDSYFEKLKNWWKTKDE